MILQSLLKKKHENINEWTNTNLRGTKDLGSLGPKTMMSRPLKSTHSIYFIVRIRLQNPEM